MMRGGHLDVCVLGAYQVAANERHPLRQALTWLDRRHADAADGEPGSGGEPRPALAGVPEALAVLADAVRHDNRDWLRYEYDRLRANTHELDELAVLRQVQSGSLNLSRSLTRSALRLLGAEGSSVQARLGCPDGATRQEQRRAASEQIARWRSLAESPGAGPAERAAFRVLVRSAEGVLVRLDD